MEPTTITKKDLSKYLFWPTTNYILLETGNTHQNDCGSVVLSIDPTESTFVLVFRTKQGLRPHIKWASMFTVVVENYSDAFIIVLKPDEKVVQIGLMQLPVRIEIKTKEQALI